MLSVIIPASNEAGYIGRCLTALLEQEGDRLDAVEIIVAANGCLDATVAIARSHEDQAAARGWRLVVLDIAEGGKPNALNEGDRAATGDLRVYVDADIVCDPELLSLLSAALDQPEPAYASCRLIVAPAKSWVTRRYADLWSRLPFMTEGVPGAGLFAVNAAGRARWGTFPEIISDDGYVRLLFAPRERIHVAADYLWPMSEGFARLVRVRRRQNAGMREIHEKFPELRQNDTRGPVDHTRLFLQAPISYLVYAAVSMAVLMGGRGPQAWTRGR